MDFGLIAVNVGLRSAEEVVGIAQLAEGAGFESVWTFEHVIVPVDYQSKYPYDKSGKMGIPPEANFIDPLIALTAVAASTKKLKLGTGVNILSQSNPLYLAKQAASLDLMSKGRFILGAGIGWLREEFDAMGVPFARRGARFDDYIQAMRKVWSGDVVEHQSDFLNWSGFKSYPIPEKKSQFPVVIGGATGKVYERVAKYGSGWYAPVSKPEELEPHLPKLKAACDGEGRDISTVELSVMFNPTGGLDAIKRFDELGVSRLIVPIQALGEDPVAGISDFANNMIANA